MFGFIKNLAKKSDKSFYLELKDDTETKPSEASNGAKPPTVVPASVAEASTTAPVAANSNGKATKKEIAAAAKTAKIQAAKGEKKAETAKVLDTSEILAAAVAKKPEVPTEKNFATKYLLTNGSSSRRRPGPNMNGFLEMARTAKTPTQK
ncbi:hypothetical protein [Brunnivagina elsteri]|uniref:Uncharacterized protein n=1 Tax=Brunnivagina elsteri CCALA 953 TaxID=987040 RepID=A0A2A2TJE3_9CYAN|nr:hypothetical protein [Calothrix elsteri]PAX55208.1 hypothetical protein CK510_11235 [Calothrix elsteri CCALA 953]